mmetsp:Transcript_12369/g.16219  ORF Transcript_12369/g.16219 Transcript_12369/m.16219 type:complete len:358 (-) Transcript_12369:169-1242(-)
MSETKMEPIVGEGPLKGGRQFKSQAFWGLLVISAVICLAWMIQEEETTSSSSSTSTTTSKAEAKNITVEETFAIPDLSRFENCTISFPQHPIVVNTSARPLFFPSGNNGFNDKTVISLLTGGLPSRNWHNQKKGLRRCIVSASPGSTAACTNGHPSVPISPERHTRQFDVRVLLGIRNLISSLPAFDNEKANKYRGIKGQVPENSWRSIRDKYFDSSVKGWIRTIQTWKNMSYFTIGTYVPYEHWLNPDLGPALIQQIANNLQEAGFAVAPPEDMACIWYKSAKDKYLKEKEFFKYVPGFTEQQRDHALVELQKFIGEISGTDDPALLSILRDYYAKIRDNTRIDIPMIVNMNTTQG